MVGEARVVALDAPGHGEHAAVHGPAAGHPRAAVVEVVQRGVAERGEVSDGVLLHAVFEQRQLCRGVGQRETRVGAADVGEQDVPAGFARSEEHTSELQSLMRSSYAAFCLKKKKTEESLV